MSRPENRELISRAGRSVWLNPSFETIAARVDSDPNERPLFQERGQAAELLRRRIPDYETADVRVDVPAGELPEATVERIVEVLRACAT